MWLDLLTPLLHFEVLITALLLDHHHLLPHRPVLSQLLAYSVVS